MVKRTVLITGATGGIGRAVAKIFDKTSIEELILTDHSSKALELAELVSNLNHTHSIWSFGCDIALNHDVELFAKTHFLQIDILINIAGIAPANMTPLVKTDLDAARKIMDVNYWGTLNMCKAVLPLMQVNGYGRIINVASISAFMADPGNIIYSASKASVVQLTKALAKEAPFNKNGPPHDITINAVAPGVIDTDMAKQLKEPMVEGFKKATPFGRLGRPEEIAEVIFWLATKAPQFLTGEVIRVDGGFLA